MVALSFPDRYLVHAREPLITQAPRVDVNSLFARGDVSTCGFVSGDVKSPLTCPTSYSCTSTVQDMIGWACCDQIQCAGNYRICADYGAQLCAGGLDASDCSSIYTSILSCSSAAPSCFSYARSLSLGAVSTYFSLACGQTSGTVLALQTFLGGNSPAAGTAASSTAPGQSSPFSTASNVGSSPTESSPSSLSAGEKAGIIVTSVGVAVTMCSGSSLAAGGAARDRSNRSKRTRDISSGMWAVEVLIMWVPIMSHMVGGGPRLEDRDALGWVNG
ncbi:hypothetical protein HO133_001975 [Letharia lupina]|uniref:Uncharacterized protein n=1 Tax=Letharia lupina TaxID=560253 RepID=A0A8H6FB61_9LECA|nr:uncharacterized protein HO133_001975 [Letharia lupina]KAF6222007.1 hypothetical protein HO133_001975 [Letharia lupina]